MLEQEVAHLPRHFVVSPAPVLAIVRGLPQDLQAVASAQRYRALAVAQVVPRRIFCGCA